MTIGQEFEMRAKVRVSSISMQTGGKMCMTLEFMAAEVKDDAARDFAGGSLQLSRT